MFFYTVKYLPSPFSYFCNKVEKNPPNLAADRMWSIRILAKLVLFSELVTLSYIWPGGGSIPCCWCGKEDCLASWHNRNNECERNMGQTLFGRYSKRGRKEQNNTRIHGAVFLYTLCGRDFCVGYLNKIYFELSKLLVPKRDFERFLVTCTKCLVFFSSVLFLLTFPI